MIKATYKLFRLSVQNKKLSEYNTLSCHSTSGRGLHVDQRVALGIAADLSGNEIHDVMPLVMPSFPPYIERSDDHNSLAVGINAYWAVSSAEL